MGPAARLAFLVPSSRVYVGIPRRQRVPVDAVPVNQVDPLPSGEAGLPVSLLRGRQVTGSAPGSAVTTDQVFLGLFMASIAGHPTC